jgi:hypothetical protein
MADICAYEIRLRGQVGEDEINALSPLQITREPAASHPGDPPATLFTVRTDQAGMVGLVRHLHGLGLVILSMRRVEAS